MGWGNYPTMDDEEYQRERIARGDSDKDADAAAEQLHEAQRKADGR